MLFSRSVQLRTTHCRVWVTWFEKTPQLGSSGSHQVFLAKCQGRQRKRDCRHREVEDLGPQGWDWALAYKTDNRASRGQRQDQRRCLASPGLTEDLGLWVPFRQLLQRGQVFPDVHPTEPPSALLGLTSSSETGPALIPLPPLPHSLPRAPPHGLAGCCCFCPEH